MNIARLVPWTSAALALTAASFSAQALDTTGPVTFTKDVLPIFQENCQVCHRNGGTNLGGMVAPMALMTYEETRPWAKAIAKNVSDRTMPPWHASDEFSGVFQNQRTLSQEEVDTVVAWVQTGAKRGNPSDAPEPLTFPTMKWQIGEPDLVVTMPEPYFVEDDVEDQYITFYTEVTKDMLAEDRYIKAIEFRTGSPVVHHIISDPLGGIAPGNQPTVFEDGFSQLFRTGTKVSFRMHYHKEPGPDTGTWDQSSVGVKFYPKGYEPEHKVHNEPLGSFDFKIPAGEANYTHTTKSTFDDDVMILAYAPHMHLRGKSAIYTANYPDGTSEKLLEVPNYDFNWQTSYNYIDKKVLPAGTELELTMAWNNSETNPYNPDPTKDVVYGKPTTAEMMFGFVTYAYVEEPAVILNAADLVRFVGKYQIGDDEFLTLTVNNGMLHAHLPSNPEFDLETVGPTTFRLRFVKLDFNFVVDDAENVTSVKISQDGSYQGEAPKVD